MYTIIFLGECLLYAVYHLITFTHINLCCQEKLWASPIRWDAFYDIGSASELLWMHFTK